MYSANSDFLGDVGLFVDVDFIKVNPRKIPRELLKYGGDNAARSTPRRPEINDGRLVAVDLRTSLAQLS